MLIQVPLTVSGHLHRELSKPRQLEAMQSGAVTRQALQQRHRLSAPTALPRLPAPSVQTVKSGATGSSVVITQTRIMLLLGLTALPRLLGMLLHNI